MKKFSPLRKWAYFGLFACMILAYVLSSLYVQSTKNTLDVALNTLPLNVTREYSMALEIAKADELFKAEVISTTISIVLLMGIGSLIYYFEKNGLFYTKEARISKEIDKTKEALSNIPNVVNSTASKKVQK